MSVTLRSRSPRHWRLVKPSALHDLLVESGLSFDDLLSRLDGKLGERRLQQLTSKNDHRLHRVYPDTIRRLADALNTTVADLDQNPDINPRAKWNPWIHCIIRQKRIDEEVALVSARICLNDPALADDLQDAKAYLKQFDAEAEMQSPSFEKLMELDWLIHRKLAGPHWCSGQFLSELTPLMSEAVLKQQQIPPKLSEWSHELRGLICAVVREDIEQYRHVLTRHTRHYTGVHFL